MSEYLDPRVHLAEVSFHATDIGGVSTSTPSFADPSAHDPASAVAQAESAGDWTAERTHDPGVGILELLRWLESALDFRALGGPQANDTRSDATTAVARRLGDR
jgi:hypothetical protein